MLCTIRIDEGLFDCRVLPQQGRDGATGSGPTGAEWVCYLMMMGSISMCSNTLYMSNMDGGSSLRWLSASIMT